jgi:aryl-alcohol dehydrogenase-like predicted oxidoreductase
MTDRIPLGKTELMISRLGVGVMTWSDKSNAFSAYGGSSGPEEEERAFSTCLEAGINFFDTAEMYGFGSSERRLGALSQGKDIVLATKFFPRPPRLVGSLPGALEGSLARLGRTSVELYQIHFPVFWMSIPKLMDRLADAVEAGKVKAVGVSNYSAAQMRQAHEALARRGIPLASNQIQYSLLHRKPEVDGTLEACRELGVTLIAYSPLAMGALSGKYSAAARPSDRLRRYLGLFRADKLAAITPVIDLLRGIGGRYGKSPSQVALRWLIEQERVVPIPGAKNSKQAAENAAALTFSLTAAETEALSKATSSFRA